MLTIVLNWLYIFFITFCLGFAFMQFSEKVFGYSFKSMNTVLMAGLVISTVYAQIFSIFYRVSTEANVLLIILGVVGCVVWRKRMAEFIKHSFQGCSLTCKILIPLLFLVWVFFTSRGYTVPDMDLYHGQSIRWIEEYGVVKGLGNLHTRFGYNSAIFATSALFSMKFLLGHSLHTVNGWIALLMSIEVLNLGKVFRRKKMHLSDYARVGAFYYLTTVWDEIIAPSSDYAVMLTIFFVVIKWLSQLEEDDESERNNIAPYALLCVVGVYTLTLKVTAGLILILLIKPAYMLIKQKRWKEIAIYLALGLIVAVPWFTRNVLITGWLLYPFPALDLFQVDWKMTDVSEIIVDAELIKVYAKGLQNVGINVPLREWFPHWFSTQLSSMEKLLILGDLFACVSVLTLGIKVFVKKQWQKLDVLLVMGAVFGSYLFWQFSAPLMRYGYAHVLLLVAIVYGYLLEAIPKIKQFRPVLVVYAAMFAFMVYKLFVGGAYIQSCATWLNFVWQETYDSYEMEAYEVDGVTLYYSVSQPSLCGYDPFPSAPMQQLDIELRGEGLEDGFRRKANE